jgi:hypothetical protein
MPPLGMGCHASASARTAFALTRWAVGVGSQCGGSANGAMGESPLSQSSGVVGPEYEKERKAGDWQRESRHPRSERTTFRNRSLQDRSMRRGSGRNPPQPERSPSTPHTTLFDRPARAGRPTSEANFIDKTVPVRKENTGNFGTFGILRPRSEPIMATYGHLRLRKVRCWFGLGRSCSDYPKPRS